MKRVTIKDIARDLNLSVSTVSRALSGDKSISSATVARTEEAARRLGYRRNMLATKLRTGYSNTIGVLVNELDSTLASGLISGIQSVMAEHHFHVLIANSDNNPAEEMDNIGMFEHAMIDGLIVCLCDKSEAGDEIKRLIAAGLPVVLCDCLSEMEGAAKLISNHYNKSFFLIEHIIRSGRKRIIHLSGDSVLPKYAMMADGYRDALRKFNLYDGPEMIRRCAISVEGGREAAECLIRDNIDFDALFACSDLIAIGAMNRLRELGRKVPEDVSVAGYSGSPLSTLVYPELTTVETPMRTMGEKAAHLLLKKFADPAEPAPTVVLESRICLRGSSHL